MSCLTDVPENTGKFILAFGWRSFCDKHTCVHLFERFPLCFLDEEPNEYHECPIEDAKHQKGLPPKILNGVWRSLGEDKVEQPLCGSSNSDAGFADSGWEDFTHVDLDLSQHHISNGEEAAKKLTHGAGPHEMLYDMASR